ISVSRISGTKLAPRPWILCGPGSPPLRIGDSAGSTAMICTPGLRALSTCPTPVMVPPVPMPATTMSTWPSVSFQISSAVVLRWISGLASLANCRARIPPRSAAISSDLGPAFLAHRLGHGEHDVVAAGRPDHGERDPRVARRGLDDRAARLELTGRLG